MELLDYLKYAAGKINADGSEIPEEEAGKRKHASDMFIVAGRPVCFKMDKKIEELGERMLPADTEVLIRNIYELSGRSIDRFLSTGDDDFSFAVAGVARFRVNTYMQRNSMAAVIRVIAFTIPDWQSMHITEEIMGLAEVSNGIIIISGSAGSGKSTTQACLIDRINRTRACHIITLEDPIEYLHRHNKSIVSQREVSIDTADYQSALRACLRQAPDVILLGEMRDYETIRTAMTAAETGHLVIGTLHTRGAVSTIARIIDTFPSEQQGQIRVQLSSVLHSIVSQQLLPGTDGDLVAAFEVMHVNGAIRSMIRDNKDHQIENAIASGSSEGMNTMDQAILALCRSGKITRETALGFADNQDQMSRKLG